MDTQAILETLKTFTMFLLGVLAWYFSVSQKAQAKAKQVQEVFAEITAKAVIFIREAEEDYKDTTNKGGEKFTQVVNKLHNLVPTQLQGIITRDMIENVVQSTFDEIEEYVKIQLDSVVNE